VFDFYLLTYLITYLLTYLLTHLHFAYIHTYFLHAAESFLRSLSVLS